MGHRPDAGSGRPGRLTLPTARVQLGRDRVRKGFYSAYALDLIIDLKTANALGLTIPPSLLFRADKVIK